MFFVPLFSWFLSDWMQNWLQSDVRPQVFFPVRTCRDRFPSNMFCPSVRLSVSEHPDASRVASLATFELREAASRCCLFCSAALYFRRGGKHGRNPWLCFFNKHGINTHFKQQEGSEWRMFVTKASLQTFHTEASWRFKPKNMQLFV